MRAIGFTENGSIDREGALLDLNLPKPTPTGRDISVEVKAISVNPVDGKMRTVRVPAEGVPEVLGYDAAGIVAAVGPDVSLFKVGDEVFYAGALTRPGTNAEFHLVDERIVGFKPKSLDWAQSAAMPLTTVTAWEGLFDRLNITKPVAGGANAILIVGGAGGVGSIAIQLVKQLTDLTVIATASRPETVEWVKKMGADHVINHREPLAPQVEALNIGAPSFVFSTTQTNQHAANIAELIAPQGRFGLIDALDSIDPFKMKSVSVHLEFMFTRSMFETADMNEQGVIFNKVAAMLDAGKLVTTIRERLSPINAETLTKAHRMSESGSAIGKIVLEGF